MGTLIGVVTSCLWQTAVVVADVIANGAGIMGCVGT